MKTLPLPPLELLQQLLEVDKTSPSGLKWKEYRAYNAKPGDIAGWLNKRLNRWQIGINKKKYYCYRIQFYLETGLEPGNNEIDHENHNTVELEKIRIATRSQNELNKTKMQSRSGKKTSSAYKGVCWKKDKNKWRARVYENGKYRHLGYFKTEKEAALAYNVEHIRIAGEFACPNIIEEVEKD